MKAFLDLEEIQVPVRSDCLDDVAGVTMKNCTFSRDASFVVRVEDLHFGRGLNMVVGQIGSGKTTLLLGMLGLISNGSGSCVVDGSVAFASQTA